MARNRTISPDFWTWEAVIDCKPMTRLLFLGLWNFADDFGVQPLRPRTIAMQVFPGDPIDGDAVRAMVDELVAQGLVRLYEVEGVAYVAVVDWNQLQRVGTRARRRYPPDAGAPSGRPAPTIANHSNGQTPPSLEAGEHPSRAIANHSNTETPRGPPTDKPAEQPSRTMANHSNGAPRPFGMGSGQREPDARLRMTAAPA